MVADPMFFFSRHISSYTIGKHEEVKYLVVNKALPFKLCTGIRSWLSNSSQVPFLLSARPILTAQTPNQSRESKACTPSIHSSVGAASNMTAFFIVSVSSVPTHGLNKKINKKNEEKVCNMDVCASPYSLSCNSKHIQTQELGEYGGQQALWHWLLHVPGSGKENEWQFSYVHACSYAVASFYLKYNIYI